MKNENVENILQYKEWRIKELEREVCKWRNRFFSLMQLATGIFILMIIIYLVVK